MICISLLLSNVLVVLFFDCSQKCIFVFSIIRMILSLFGLCCSEGALAPHGLCLRRGPSGVIIFLLFLPLHYVGLFGIELSLIWFCQDYGALVIKNFKLQFIVIMCILWSLFSYGHYLVIIQCFALSGQYLHYHGMLTLVIIWVLL